MAASPSIPGETSVQHVTSSRAYQHSLHRQVVLFTGRDYASFQSRFEDQSPLYRALTQRVQDKDGALFGCNIAVTNATLADTGLQASTAPTENSASGESFDAVIYPERIALPFTLTSASVESGRVDDFISNLPRQSLVTSIDSCTQKERRDLQSTSPVDIYVCVSQSCMPSRQAVAQSIADSWSSRLPVRRSRHSCLRCACGGSKTPP